MRWWAAARPAGPAPMTMTGPIGLACSAGAGLSKGRWFSQLSTCNQPLLFFMSFSAERSASGSKSTQSQQGREQQGLPACHGARCPKNAGTLTDIQADTATRTPRKPAGMMHEGLFCDVGYLAQASRLALPSVAKLGSNSWCHTELHTGRQTSDGELCKSAPEPPDSPSCQRGPP